MSIHSTFLIIRIILIRINLNLNNKDTRLVTLAEQTSESPTTANNQVKHIRVLSCTIIALLAFTPPSRSLYDNEARREVSVSTCLGNIQAGLHVHSLSVVHAHPSVVTHCKDTEAAPNERVCSGLVERPVPVGHPFKRPELCLLQKPQPPSPSRLGVCRLCQAYQRSLYPRTVVLDVKDQLGIVVRDDCLHWLRPVCTQVRRSVAPLPVTLVRALYSFLLSSACLPGGYLPVLQAVGQIMHMVRVGPAARNLRGAHPCVQRSVSYEVSLIGCIRAEKGHHPLSTHVPRFFDSNPVEERAQGEQQLV